MNNKKYYCLLLLMFFSVGTTKCIAQQDLARALDEINNSMAFYKNTPSLRYAMYYTYANESAPGKILDSLTGIFEIKDGSYRYVVDSTETIGNDRLAVMLFKKDKTMYLTKPGKQQNALNSLAGLDSSLWHVPGLQCTVIAKDSMHIISLLFPAATRYKKISLSIDTATHFIQTVECVVKTDELLENHGHTIAIDKSYDDYGIIKLRLSGYDKEVPGFMTFDERNFFKRTGKQFIVTEPYKDYKILIGSPNL